jgi:hypothetical protein
MAFIGSKDASMLEHELFQLLILGEGLKARSSDKTSGRAVFWPTLEKAAEACHLDAHGRGLMDALLLLRKQGKITLKKILPAAPDRTFPILDFSECPEREFFTGQFNIVVTEEGAAYFNELEANARTWTQAMSGIAVPKKTRIGFYR